MTEHIYLSVDNVATESTALGKYQFLADFSSAKVCPPTVTTNLPLSIVSSMVI